MSNFRKFHNKSHKDGQRDTRAKDGVKKVSKHVNVPLLTRSEDGSTNLMIWRKRVSDLLLESYGDLGRFTNNGGVYFIPDEIEFNAEELNEQNDPYGFRRDEIRELRKNRLKHIESMKSNRVPCFATLRSTLSNDIEESIKELEEWDEVLQNLDPLRLWNMANFVATNDGPIESTVDTAYSARQKYNACVMNSEESIVEFHERFEFAAEMLQATNEIKTFNDQGDVIERRDFMTPQDIARDFLGRLDARYQSFKNDVSNSARSGAAAMPRTLPEMYALACAYKGVGPKSQKQSGTVFATVTSGHGSTSNKQNEIECFHCHEKGHVKRQCPKLNVNPDRKSSDKKGQQARTHNKVGYSVVGKHTIFTAFDNNHITMNTVILDSGANTSRFGNAKLLVDVREERNLPAITAFGGEVLTCSSVGTLPGFFEIGINQSFQANVLSLHEVENTCEVTYLKGDRYVIKCRSGDVFHFVKGVHGLYTAEFSEYDQQVEGHMVINNIAERRSKYSLKELATADAAWDFIKNANVSEDDAITMLTRTPDIIGHDITKESVRNAFKINVADVAAVKGKTRRHNPKTGVVEADKPPETTTKQTLFTDVMFIRNVPTMVTVVHPLDLTLGTVLSSHSEKEINRALTEQLVSLDRLGLKVNKIHTDRHPSFLALRGGMGNVVIESCGAGDHVGRAENRIKTLKEMFRTVVSRLPYHLPRRLTSELIFYVIKRINSIPDGHTHRVPRVSATGIKINFRTEFAMGFGDYAEVRNPHVVSNDAMAPRTDSAIALWPMGNSQGSWKFFDLSTEKTIIRSQYKRLPTTDLVIARMNAIFKKDEGIPSTEGAREP